MIIVLVHNNRLHSGCSSTPLFPKRSNQHHRVFLRTTLGDETTSRDTRVRFHLSLSVITVKIESPQGECRSTASIVCATALLFTRHPIRAMSIHLPDMAEPSQRPATGLQNDYHPPSLGRKSTFTSFVLLRQSSKTTLPTYRTHHSLSKKSSRGAHCQDTMAHRRASSTGTSDRVHIPAVERVRTRRTHVNVTSITFPIRCSRSRCPWDVEISPYWHPQPIDPPATPPTHAPPFNTLKTRTASSEPIVLPQQDKFFYYRAQHHHALDIQKAKLKIQIHISSLSFYSLCSTRVLTIVPLPEYPSTAA